MILNFELQMPAVPGEYDWNIRFHECVLGIGQAGRRIESDDAAIVERLRASEVLEIVTGLRTPDITYRAMGRTLTISGDLGSDLVPNAESFSEQLACIAQLRQINSLVNMA